MVYRGKPSTGCKKCRSRKIKCDERPSGCRNCADKNFICPGYDNPLDRYFQDETRHVQARVTEAKTKALAARDEREARETYVRAQRALLRYVQQPHHVGDPLLNSLAEQGLTYFMGHLALGAEKPSMSLSAVPEHLPTHGFHPLLATAMTALGLVGISHIYRDLTLKAESLKWYLRALRLTNTAISSPADVKTDTTLMATLLLRIYEATSNDNTLDPYNKHIEGSMSLIRLRGTEQFKTPAGRRLYFQAVAMLGMHCMSKNMALPSFIHELNQQMPNSNRHRDPSEKFFHLQSAVVDFRASIWKGEITDLDAIVQQALAFDHAITSQVFKDTGPEWHYAVIVPTEEEKGFIRPGALFEDQFHIYSHMAAAQTWNWVRYTRIYLHDIIRNTTTAYSRIHQPNPNPPTNPTPHAPPSSSQTDNPTPPAPTETLPILRTSGGYSTLWALYIAAATPCATPAIQNFVLNCFSRVARELGISQGRVLAACLRGRMAEQESGHECDMRTRSGWKGETVVARRIVDSYLPRTGGGEGNV
ncbi:hypothetical protein M011DRAFT_441845 [Sporormia fimetaria CBS 119925]|uniref:Zn(2)-C6 fungal-type domain-containing protein n=1 Tax=Sporormia fimetaria CBS 119925 TaxID=1340428 RepID=A0A6A6VGW2_9PLEO|nr:hypothetical protein M011DRAFT_441845 [Sporormia fimetaria CBS 119925]